MPSSTFWVRAIIAVVAGPRVWGTAIRQARRLARPGWWRRAPFLPVPDREYLAFRFTTQYGGAAPDARDLVAYLEWCRAMERAGRA